MLFVLAECWLALARNNFERAMLCYVEAMVAFDKGLIACDMTQDDMDEVGD